MRDPRFWRNVALAFLVAGPIAIAAATLLPTDADVLRSIGFLFGLMASIFGGVAALVLHLDVRAKQAIDLGEDLLANWRIDAPTWRDFIALDRELGQTPGACRNEFSPKAEIPADGVAIVIGKSAISIDGDVHRLPLRGTPEITHAEFNESRVRLSYVQMDLHYPDGGYGASGVPQSSSRSCLRFPVPPGSSGDAERIVAHYGGMLPGTPDFFHGRGDGSDPEDLSKCWSCGFETHRLQSLCPQCGSPLQSKRWSRRFGLLTTLCGLFITGLIGVVLYCLTPLLLHPGVQIGNARFDGTPAAALGILGLLAVVFAFGMIALLYGAWQMKTGRRNQKVVSVMTAIVSLLMLVAWVMQRSAG